MDWWQSARDLLARPDAPAGQALRWGLEGLRGCLSAALARAPDDPDARRVLAGLEEWLSPAKPQAAPTASPRLHFGELAAAAESDPALGSLRLPRTTDADLWEALHWHLLAVPEDVAQRWRDHARRAATAAGAQLVPATEVGPPLSTEEELIPGLAGTVNTAGLRGEPATDLADAALAPLATAFAACHWLAASGRGVRHALLSLCRFDIPALEGTVVADYQAELRRRWAVVADPGARQRAPGPWLKALLDLDEAIQSLLPWPLPAPGSWWTRWRQKAREAVRTARKLVTHPAQIQLLAGPYAPVHARASDSLRVESGTPGEVVVCLRQWAQIDGTEHKGRVLYRPLEGS